MRDRVWVLSLIIGLVLFGVTLADFMIVGSSDTLNSTNSILGELMVILGILGMAVSLGLIVFSVLTGLFSLNDS